MRMTFLFAEPTQLWLELSPTSVAEAWQHSQSFSTAGRCWRAYLNRLCLQGVQPWLEEESQQQATVFLKNGLSSVWEMVNGTAVEIAGKRFVLIPTEDIDSDELRVPQEWVDLPRWAGDYYLAVQVNVEEQCLRIWGYTTHRHLKTRGNYDRRDRAYTLAAEDLVRDISLLGLARQSDESTRTAIEPLPELPAIQGSNLLQRLGNLDVIFPRNAIPFALWGALFDRDDWRDRLYRLRQGNPAEPILANLGQWFENLFETGWQSIESLFPNSENLALGWRRTEAEVRRVKEIELGGRVFALVVGLAAEADGRTSIRVQLRPGARDRVLPEGIQLLLRSESGEILKSVAARSQDDYIQLQRFKCVSGYRFDLQITLDEFSTAEAFQV